MFTFSGETDNSCLLMTHLAELKSHSQGTDIVNMQNAVFAIKASLVM